MMMNDAEKALDALHKEWSFLTGIGTCYIPEDSSVEAKVTALFKNQQDLRNRIGTGQWKSSTTTGLPPTSTYWD